MAGNAIEIRVDGLKELKERFASLDKEGRRRVNRAINLNATELQREVRKVITKNTGRYIKYRRGGKAHWSSTPRRAPNSDTGNLKKLILVTQRSSSSRLGAVVISGAKYSAALEFGHKITPRRGALVTVRRAPTVEGPRRGHVAPRPFMFPTLEKNRKVFVARIREAIKGVLTTRGAPKNMALNRKISAKK